MSNPPLIFGPIPLYNNPPIEPQFFQPSIFFISAITLGQTTIITTSVNHNYVIGQQVRLLIPNGYGCIQLNEQIGNVINIPATNQVTINLYSANANPFINANLATKPQIVAIGDVNTGSINSNGIISTLTNIPGSFLNISPQ